MTRRARGIALLFGLALAAGAPLPAQSLPETVEAIDRARVTTRILYITAHPDDESASVLTYLARGLGADVALLSITRGEGGQNALGPEQGAQLGVLRSEELLAATRAYGVRLYFTRAPDFGYSKTIEETQRIWGESAIEDMVRVIRTFRPHIVINNWGEVETGHGHHQTAGILTPKAAAAAADPNISSQQLAEGLTAWRVRTVLEYDRSGKGSGYRVPLDDISPIWGKSYREIGLEGFVNHRTQGIAGFLGSPFFRRSIYLVSADRTPFDPKILAMPFSDLAREYPGYNERVVAADQALAEARAAALRLDWAGAAKALAAAGKGISGMLSDLQAASDPALAELRFDSVRTRERIDAALALVTALRIKAESDRREIVAGEPFNVTLEVRQRRGILDRVEKPELLLPAGWNVAKRSEQAGNLQLTVDVPPGASPPSGPDDWMQPRPAPLVRARVRASVAAYSFDVEAPAVVTQATSTRIETLPLALVPAVTLQLEPKQFLLVEKNHSRQLEIVTRVRFYGTRATSVSVGIEVPAGWPAPATAALKFDHSDDHLARLSVFLPEGIPAGSYTLNAYAKRGKEVFRSSVEPLPTLPSRLWTEPATVSVRVLDLAVPKALSVGYVAAENDPIPEILRQVGIGVELLDPAALAFGDLSRFDAIAIGIRAYELRGDLARANQRLLDYAAAGGTLVVQYQRSVDWNRLKPAPYPATVGQPTVRITDRNSPVRFLKPDHPVLSFPNRINLEDFRGWVQERGLYFFSDYDSRYEPILALRDPGEEETLGGLVYARIGKGVYIYTGLAFFRQLPEGVPGAIRLFVNLLAQSRAPHR